MAPWDDQNTIGEELLTAILRSYSSDVSAMLVPIILGDEPLAVPDAGADPRFNDLPTIRDGSHRPGPRLPCGAGQVGRKRGDPERRRRE